MHVLSATDFLVTLAISLATTTLVSRVLYFLIRRRTLGIPKVAIVNCVSFVISYILIVMWCSTPDRIYWFAGHVAFAPQFLLFIYDVLHWTEEEDAFKQHSEIDS